MTDKVDEYLPPFFYAFDDRGNLSIGVDCEMIREELPEIEFGGEEPEGFVGLCYEVNDRGSLTVWDCDGAGNRTEYLAIV